MLVLTRKIGERVMIGHDIEVTVLKIQGNRVKLGIRGPSRRADSSQGTASEDSLCLGGFQRPASVLGWADRRETRRRESGTRHLLESRSGHVSGLATRPTYQVVQDRETADTDRKLERRIRNFLEGLSLPELRNLELEVRNGAAVITGRVRTFYEKQLATSCCQRVAGVLSVLNEVQVADSPEMPAMFRGGP